MNHEDFENLNRAKQKIVYLLKTKYGDVSNEYRESSDTDTDSKMNSIIKLLTDSTSYAFQMIPYVKQNV